MIDQHELRVERPGNGEKKLAQAIRSRVLSWEGAGLFCRDKSY